MTNNIEPVPLSTTASDLPAGDYLNHYEHCDAQWTERWSCMCNDRCLVCNIEIEPYKSEELDAEGNAMGTVDHTTTAAALFPKTN